MWSPLPFIYATVEVPFIVSDQIHLHRRERGISLVVTLLMIVAVAALAVTSARFALSGERSTRADRDRELALQAAETALADGQEDIYDKAGTGRGKDFCGKGLGFPETGCLASAADRGKCAPEQAGQTPPWLAVDWSTQGVPVGTFTGGPFYPTQNGIKSWLPVTTPRYVIEPVSDREQDTAARFSLTDTSSGRTAANSLYLITAIGYSTRPDVKVVLQAIVRKSQFKC